MSISSGSTRTLFFSPQYLRENTGIDNNVEGKLLEVSIRKAEDKYIKNLIGGNLYSTLINKINSSTLTGVYKDLMDQFIVPCLLDYALYEYIPFSSLKFKNKGVSKQTSDTSEPAEREDLYYMRDNVLDTAQFYGEELIRHLKANISSFPEYLAYVNGQTSPANGDYFSGIHIPGENRGNCDGSGLGITYDTNL